MSYPEILNKYVSNGRNISCWNCEHTYHVHPEATEQDPAVRVTSCVVEMMGFDLMPTTTLIGQFGPPTVSDGSLLWCSQWRQLQNPPPLPPLP